MSIATITRIVASLLLLGLGIGGFLAMGTAEVARKKAPEKGPPIVETTTAVAHEAGIEFEVDGVVVPYRQVAVAAEVDGRIAFKAEACRTGRAVKRGDLLFRIDQRNYNLEVVRLQEELKQSNALLEELQLEIKNVGNQVALSEEQLEIDVRELARNEGLQEVRAASSSELDRVRRAELATRNSLQGFVDQRNLLIKRKVRLESGRALVQAQLDRAELDLSRTEIRAPWDGVVVSESVEQDGYVQRGSTVIMLQGTSTLDVTCKLRIEQMHWLWQGNGSAGPTDPEGQSSKAYDFPNTPATVIYHLGTEAFAWRGELNRYDGPGLDDQTRMVPCRVHVTNPLEVASIGDAGSSATNLKPPTLMTGMFVKVRIRAKPAVALVRAPQRAVQPGNVIWTVVEGALERKQLRVAHASKEFVLAYQEEGGLQPGEIVVVSTLAAPSEGLAVKTRSVQ